MLVQVSGQSFILHFYVITLGQEEKEAMQQEEEEHIAKKHEKVEKNENVEGGRGK